MPGVGTTAAIAAGSAAVAAAHNAVVTGSAGVVAHNAARVARCAGTVVRDGSHSAADLLLGVLVFVMLFSAAIAAVAFVYVLVRDIVKREI